MKTLKKILYIAFIFLPLILAAQNQSTEFSSKSGSFARMGFGARGIGMANSMAAVTSGNLVSYYNPALSVYQEKNSFHTSYSFLSMDRSLNFLNFTKRFEFGSENKKRKARAGLSLGIINAGVDNIQERDNQGNKVGDVSTSENQFFISVANQISNKLSIGVGIKFYYYDLYEEISSSGVGFDVGALFRFSDRVKMSLVISDINSKYEWDTNELYDEDGNNTTYNFPTSKKIGLSYLIKKDILISGEFDLYDGDNNFLRFGAEYNIFENLFLRGGIDRINLSNTDYPIRPSFGFSYLYKLNSNYVGVDYAFVFEPYSAGDRHIVGVNFRF